MLQVLIAAIIAFLYALVVIRLWQIKIARRAIRVFVFAGFVLSLLRIGSLFYLGYRMESHTFSSNTLLLSYVLVPEIGLFSSIRQPNVVLDTLLTSAVLIVGSFLWALPLLLFWGVPKRQLN